MKTLLTGIAAAAILLAVQSANAIPTLTLSDNNGHSTNYTDASGVVNYTGGLGNWNINNGTGIVAPPADSHNGTVTQPFMDLGGFDNFHQTTGGALVGNVLTITFTGDDLGPIDGLLSHFVGGAPYSGLSAVFNVFVNDVLVTTINGFGSAFAPITAPSGSTVALQAVLTATNSSADISFDSQLSVPDAGTTWAMLGCGLVGLIFYRRSRKAA